MAPLRHGLAAPGSGSTPRPLGREGWALHLVANLKLPMRDKVETLERARSVLEEGGWKALRMRQLYHDRDEVTVVARSR